MGIVKGFLTIIFGILILTFSISGGFGGVCTLLTAISVKTFVESITTILPEILGDNILTIILTVIFSVFGWIFGFIFGIFSAIICVILTSVFGMIIGGIMIMIGFLKFLTRD